MDKIGTTKLFAPLIKSNKFIYESNSDHVLVLPNMKMACPEHGDGLSRASVLKNICEPTTHLSVLHENNVARYFFERTCEKGWGIIERSNVPRTDVVCVKLESGKLTDEETVSLLEILSNRRVSGSEILTAFAKIGKGNEVMEIVHKDLHTIRSPFSDVSEMMSKDPLDAILHKVGKQKYQEFNRSSNKQQLFNSELAIDLDFIHDQTYLQMAEHLLNERAREDRLPFQVKLYTSPNIEGPLDLVEVSTAMFQ